MPTARTPLPRSSSSSAPDEVADTLLHRILHGAYGDGGGRLPSERELQVELRTGRGSVRAALGRLADWGMLEVRHGSGAVLQKRRTWRLDVLTAVLRHALRAETPAVALRLAGDVLELRRAIMIAMLGLAAGRVSPGALGGARAAATAAWEARSTPRDFVEKEIELVRALFETAEIWPALWLFNSQAALYRELAVLAITHVPIPSDYTDRYHRLCDAIEAGNAEASRRIAGELMLPFDATLTTMLARATE